MICASMIWHAVLYLYQKLATVVYSESSTPAVLRPELASAYIVKHRRYKIKEKKITR